MPRTTFIVLLVLCASLGLFAQSKKASQQNDQQAATHTQWIAQALSQMQTIKVGMTRADLLKVFTTEGGISTRTQRTYVYRECPFIKVDVTFIPVDSKSAKHAEMPTDRIQQISRPYLAWTNAD